MDNYDRIEKFVLLPLALLIGVPSVGIFVLAAWWMFLSMAQELLA